MDSSINDLIGQAQAALQRSELQQAGILFRQVLHLDPNNVDALHLLGVVAHHAGETLAAVELISRAIQINPSVPSFYLNLGNALKDQKRLDEAITCYRTALQIDPGYAKAYNNLGVALKDQEKLDQAISSLQKALQIEPNYVEAILNFGTTLQLQEKIDQATQYLLRALKLEPNNPQIHVALGTALNDQGYLDTAISCYEAALRLNPNYATAYRSRSRALLLNGDLQRGWQDFEWRWHTSDCDYRSRDFPQPWWQGEDLTGKTVLVWAEQGVGDEILFASMLPDIVACAGHCIVECDARLAPLFARSFPHIEAVPRSNPPNPRLAEPDIQFQTPMGSLARFFRNSLDSFPDHQGYLLADPKRIAYWKSRLAELGSGKKVGICWRSMLQSANRNMHYTRLDQWGPILSVPGITFVNLQYDDCSAELASAEQQFGIKIHAYDQINLLNDLDGAAALTSALDLVISAPTSVAAMAGALGVAVWELAAKQGNWSTLGTDHMPWYPQMKLFTRPWNVDWENVINSISHDLEQLEMM